MKEVKDTRRANNSNGIGGFTRTNTAAKESVSKGHFPSISTRTPPTNGRGSFKGSPNKGTPSVSFSVPKSSDMPKPGVR
jgi:hypothetical protein